MCNGHVREYLLVTEHLLHFGEGYEEEEIDCSKDVLGEWEPLDLATKKLD